MSITPALPAVMPASLASQPKDSPAKIKEAASQFEALLIQKMLESARSNGGTGMPDEAESDAGSTLVELGEQQLSQALASGGGFGIAKMIVRGLESHANR